MTPWSKKIRDFTLLGQRRLEISHSAIYNSNRPYTWHLLLVSLPLLVAAAVGVVFAVTDLSICIESLQGALKDERTFSLLKIVKNYLR